MADFKTMNCPSCNAPIQGAGTCPYCRAELRENSAAGQVAHHEVSGEPPWLEDVRRLAKGGKKILAIKKVRTHTGIGLKEAKEFVEDGLADRARIAALPAAAPAASSASCFPASAQVDTPGGPRSIDSLKPGDAVWSYCPAAGRKLEMVTRVLVHPQAQLWTIELDGHVTLSATANHRLLTQRGWRRVDCVTREDRLVHPAGAASMKICSVAPSHRHEPVYNLYTTGPHTFVVDGGVAHNFSVLPGLRTLWHRMFVDPFFRPVARPDSTTPGGLPAR